MRNKIDKYGLCLEEYTSNKNNADVYFKRAIGKYPEMEVSKALSKIVNKSIKNNEKVLDVGCATGHFYRSLKKELKKFFYTGCDPYEIFLKLARKAWKNEKNTKFIKANIYKLLLKKITRYYLLQQCFASFTRFKKTIERINQSDKRKLILRM